MTGRLLLVIVLATALGATACTTAGPGGDVSGGGPPAIAVKSIDNEWHFTCAADREGQAWCWGEAVDGQLGNGVTAGQSLTPQEVVGIDDAVDITTGYSHACALRESGSVWCWGENDKGQLGDGTYDSSNTPVEVRGIVDATSVSAGDDFACASRENGRVVCWGDHYHGQLGAGVLWLWADHSVTPLLVTGLLDAVDIEAGRFHACAEKADGTAVCWGNGGNGKLGNGSTSNQLTPVAVAGLSGITDMTGGTSHTCAVVTPQVYCWGGDSSGQTTGSGVQGTNVMTPTVVLGAPAAVSVDAGSGHTCAVDAAGQMMCWGSQLFGQLGNGATAGRAVPTAYSVPGVVHVGLGFNHSCVATQTGHVYCSGKNDFGEVGDGTTTQRVTPTQTVGFEPPTP